MSACHLMRSHSITRAAWPAGNSTCQDAGVEGGGGTIGGGAKGMPLYALYAMMLQGEASICHRSIVDTYTPM